MAPRQRNVSTPPTPTTSEDESDTSLLQEQKSGLKRKSLTTPPKNYEITEDIARDNHDYFNIVALAVVVYTVALNYEYPSLAYTGEYFWTMWAVSSKISPIFTASLNHAVFCLCCWHNLSFLLLASLPVLNLTSIFFLARYHKQSLRLYIS